MAKNRIVGHINYSKGLRLKNPSEKDSEKEVVAFNQEVETIDLALLAEHIRDHGSCYSKGTIYGVMTDMVECIIELLRGGYGVFVDGIGKFGVSLQSDGVDMDEVEDFSASNIKGVNLTFRPAEGIKSALSTNMEFEYVGTRIMQAQAKKQEEVNLAQGLSAATSGGSGIGGNSGGSGSGDAGDVTP